MVQIIFSDELNKLTSEMKTLMQQAADEALASEFGEEIVAAGFAVSETVAELGVTVVSDEEIRELNSDYRGIDKVTDVLSFPQFEDHDDLVEELIDTADFAAESGDEADLILPVLLGDVVICCDQAARQAKEYGTGITREMLYLFVHSVMHLFGYDHMEAGEKTIMRAREESVLGAMGITRE